VVLSTQEFGAIALIGSDGIHRRDIVGVVLSLAGDLVRDFRLQVIFCMMSLTRSIVGAFRRAEPAAAPIPGSGALADRVVAIEGFAHIANVAELIRISVASEGEVNAPSAVEVAEDFVAFRPLVLLPLGIPERSLIVVPVGIGVVLVALIQALI
jgi:hypothetical protein